MGLGFVMGYVAHTLGSAHIVGAGSNPPGERR